MVNLLLFDKMAEGDVQKHILPFNEHWFAFVSRELYSEWNVQIEDAVKWLEQVIQSFWMYVQSTHIMWTFVFYS